MPNHVANEVIFRGVDAATQEKILAAVCNRDGKVDFEILLPVPINYWMGSVGIQHKEAFPGNALDWCTANWGTKWNAYGDNTVERTEDMLTLRFDTAWRPPMGWFVALFNTLKLTFEYNWLSEGESRGHSGKFDWSKMETMFADGWVEKECNEELQKHLHMLRWGCESFPEEEEVAKQ
jgi:hypothetical protein